MGKISSLLLAISLLFASCSEKSVPLAHPADCRFATPEALAQSFALCLRDADFTCANNYLPGIGNILKSPADTTNNDFGNKADNLLVGALKKEVEKIREDITEKGGELAKLSLQKVTQTESGAVLKMTMHLKAGSLAFTLQPTGLFQNEGSWCFLGTNFEMGMGE